MLSSPINEFKRVGPQLWKKGDGGHLLIEYSVLEVIGGYRQECRSALEAGGFLVGFYKGVDLHVINLTVPQSLDKRSRFRFTRQDPKHVSQVTRWYEQSLGKINCLGEWHTHPERLPKPSDIDLHAWQGFNEGRRRQRAIFLIAGISEIWTGG